MRPRRQAVKVRDPRQRREKGQALIFVAIIMVSIFGMAALAIDAGFTQAERRNLQAQADDAALAGTRAYLSGAGTDTVHYIAMQYVGRSIGASLPVSGCIGSAICPAGTYTIGDYAVTMQDPASYVLDLSITHTQASFFGRVFGANTLTAGAAARAQPPGPVASNSLYALAAVSGAALINGGGAATQVVGGNVYAYSSFGANNSPHTTGIPPVPTDPGGTACPGAAATHVDVNGTGNGLQYSYTSGSTPPPVSNVAPPALPDGSAPTLAPGYQTFTTLSQARDAAGNWLPGLYNGIFPSGGLMNPGIYKITNASNISFGSIANASATAPATENTNGAVAIILDNTDTGTLDISNATLNGLDDLHPAFPQYVGPRDLEKTHNFLIWGGNGPAGYKGSMTVGPGATTNLSGIIYLPQTAYNSNGNSSPVFNGSFWVASMTVNGGGNGQQLFNWVCNLSAENSNALRGGLVR